MVNGRPTGRITTPAQLIRQAGTRGQIISIQQAKQQQEKKRVEALKLEEARLKQIKKPIIEQPIIDFKIGRGGNISSVKVTPSEAREIRELVNSALEKGGSVNTFGRGQKVKKAVGFIVADIKARGELLGRSALRFSRIKALEQLKGKSIPELRKKTEKEIRDLARTEGIEAIGTGMRGGLLFATPEGGTVEVKRTFKKGVETREVFRGPGITTDKLPLIDPLVEVPVKRPTKPLEKLLFKVKTKRGLLEAERRRGVPPVRAQVTGAQLTGLGLGASVISQLQFASEFIKNPARTVKETFRGLTNPNLGASIGQALTQSPSFSVGLGIGEVAGAKAGATGFAKISPQVTKVVTKISPKFRPIEKLSTGKEVIRIPSKTGGDINIEIGGSVSQLSEPLQEQVRLAGKRVVAVSAQRDLFGTVRRRKIDINKPIPGEENLKKSTLSDLKKFRQGKLPEEQIIPLSQNIVKETQGAANLLETSFFADPRGRLRPSRLGLANNDANLLDFLAGDITFKRSKPQALFFEDVQIAKFPSNLRNIEKKLKEGIALTPTEQQRLLKFQLTPTGEFKPIGFLSKEPEIILAKGEVIKRTGNSAVTLINGKRVNIIRTEIIKDSKLSNLLKKAAIGEATPNELKILKKGTGVDVSSILKKAKFVSPTGLVTTGISKIARLRPSSRTLSGLPSTLSKRVPSPLSSKIVRDLSGKIISKPFSSRIRSPASRTIPSPAIKIRPTPISKKIVRRPLKRTSLIPSRPPIFSGISPIRRGRRFPPTTIIPPPLIPKLRPSKLLGKKLPKGFIKVKSFDVLVRKNKKFQVSQKRLPFNLALKTGLDITDKTLRATFRLKPNIKTPLKKEISRVKVSKQIFRRPTPKSPLFSPKFLTIIERRNKRLSQKTEVIRIQEKRKKTIKRRKK